MPKLSHSQLQDWYKNFKKAVYEGANIDMDRTEDIGRLKIYYPDDWNVDEPTGTEGELMFACIPHDGPEYEEEPPEIEQGQERLDWIMNNLRVPKSDKEIQKLYDMSREGTLMAFLPGAGEAGMQQVYTDESNNIRVSLPISVAELADQDTLDPEDRIPQIQSRQVKEPKPEDFGLTGAPVKPEEPTNLNPGFWSWVGYLLGFNTDYAKLRSYQNYETRFQEWFDNLGEVDPDPTQRVSEYKETKRARDLYVAEVKEFWKKPMGKAVAICKGLGGMRADMVAEDDVEAMKLFLYIDSEVKFLKAKHRTLPQGQLLHTLEDVNEALKRANRTKEIVKNLVGTQPRPGDLVEWVNNHVFDPEKYQPKAYEVPEHPDYDNVSQEERTGYSKKMNILAEAAGFAAVSLPSVAGDPLFAGFNADETAQLQYSMILHNIFTDGRQNCDKFMVYLEPARMQAKTAIEEYHKGNKGQLAEILANGIRKTNREAACSSSLESAHSMNTLYLISRMWDALKLDDDLMTAAGLTKEELEETKANAALHRVVTKGLEAKQTLLEYSLYQRKMTPEQVKQAGVDLLFAYQIGDVMREEHHAINEAKNNDPKYQAALLAMKNAGSEADMEYARRQTELMDLQKPGYQIGKELLKSQWIKNTKEKLLENCNFDRLINMSREDMGSMISSKVNFRNAFLAQISQQQKANTLANEIVMQHEAEPQQQQKQL